MQAQVCETYRAFLIGQAQREANQLPRGLYKLRESLGRLKLLRDEVDRIGAVKRNEVSRYSLTHCTPDDCALWLKRLSLDVAHRMGYEVLPGIRALTQDGVPEKVVSVELANAQRRVSRLLRACIEARLVYARCIAVEYDRMRIGDSYIRPLLAEAILIV